jgi:hypothetical protein
VLRARTHELEAAERLIGTWALVAYAVHGRHAWTAICSF